MIRAVTDMDVAGKHLLVRADLNVPMAEGRVSDATRIARFAEGMRPLLDKGAALVVLSHFGRPKGRAVAGASLRHIRDELSCALHRPVRFAEHGAAADEARELGPGQVLLVENLRFDPGEETNDAALPAILRRWATFTSTTLFPARTARTPRPRRWRGSCPPPPGR
jgi:phosphoglycerate kinase